MNPVPEQGKRGLSPPAEVLAVLALLGFLAVVILLFFRDIPQGNRDFFNISLIALVGFVSTGFGYWLGSSSSSARKTELLKTPPNNSSIGDGLNEAAGEEGLKPSPVTSVSTRQEEEGP